MLQNAVNHVVHPHDPTERIRGSNPTGAAWAHNSRIKELDQQLAVGGLQVDTMTSAQALALTTQQIRALNASPTRELKLELRGHRASGQRQTVHSPSGSSTVTGPLLAMSVIATRPNGEHALGQLLADFPATTPSFLARVHTAGCITGRGLITTRVARACLIGCALHVRDVPNGAVRRQTLIAGREVMTAYIENYFDSFVTHGAPAEAGLKAALATLLQRHTNRLEIELNDQAFAAIHPYAFVPAAFNGVRGNAVSDSSNLLDMLLEAVQLPTAPANATVNYQAAVLGMFVGAVALHGHNVAARHEERSERLGTLLSLVGAVAGFFPPAAAPAALGVLVADQVRQHFSKQGLAHHNSVVDAAFAFSDSLQLDEIHANETNTFAGILRTSLRLPTA